MGNQFVTGSCGPLEIPKYVDNDPVYRFCEDNGIEVCMETSYRRGLCWNEISMDGFLLMQIDRGIELSQFINVIKILSKDFGADNFPDDGVDFDVRMAQNTVTKEYFDKFIKKFGHLFGINNNT